MIKFRVQIKISLQMHPFGALSRTTTKPTSFWGESTWLHFSYQHIFCKHSRQRVRHHSMNQSAHIFSLRTRHGKKSRLKTRSVWKVALLCLDRKTLLSEWFVSIVRISFQLQLKGLKFQVNELCNASCELLLSCEKSDLIAPQIWAQSMRRFADNLMWKVAETADEKSALETSRKSFCWRTKNSSDR